MPLYSTVQPVYRMVYARSGNMYPVKTLNDRKLDYGFPSLYHTKIWQGMEVALPHRHALTTGAT